MSKTAQGQIKTLTKKFKKKKETYCKDRTVIIWHQTITISVLMCVCQTWDLPE